MRKAVVGLGNPGARYALTRHNAGFLVVDRLAAARRIVFERSGKAEIGGEPDRGGPALTLLKPLAYMNRSGAAVAALLERLALSPVDALVVHDDLDVPLGRIKLKRDGGTGGHRGLESILEHLGSSDFPRLRVGIGRPPPGQDPATFVLEDFTAAEREVVAEALDAAVAAIGAWAELGIEAAMNRVNAPPRP